ncbi:unnamed protein product [Didymodactylos carnosus]|uniref:Uncharacterized protein n=1 Tax=Didymodactylos carnosus TaxID=1234261 RepID=A0A815TYX6_9BILA|nr:unnamed protein product [Didymodactylos carnosus]CAF1509329.1 unnamed protein product [Didymodactylos carnosus]CAF4191353.1 unnamed protein product [Didymodactylos carnosus]CAF4370224.1 unnamed protein product [Didymodactylos carnosus]
MDFRLDPAEHTRIKREEKIPELISMGKEIQHDYFTDKPTGSGKSMGLKMKIFMCQNIGLFTGVTIMYIMARFESNLENILGQVLNKLSKSN